MLTRRSKYGLKALQILAERGGSGPVLIADLADTERIPKKFLEAILLDLKRHGFLDSRKGKGGGYSLRRDPNRITVGDVIRALDGPLALVPCASQTAYRPCAECVDVATCSVRLVMRRVRDATAEILDHTTVADMAKMAADQASGRPKGPRRPQPR